MSWACYDVLEVAMQETEGSSLQFGENIHTIYQLNQLYPINLINVSTQTIHK
jgi:hypothetical protein